MIARFEERYQVSLDALAARLSRSEGSEHPDWEDSIEWRTAIELYNAPKNEVTHDLHLLLL